MLDTTHADLTDHQRSILAAVLAQPGIRRGEVSDLLGISAQTTMRAVLPLIDQGILVEDHVPSGGRGKPARQLSVVTGALATMGISLAVDRVRVEVVDPTGQPLATASAAKTYDDAAAQLHDLDALIAEARDALPKSTWLLAVGVSVQGYLMSGGTRFAAKADPEGWVQIDLLNHLERQLGVPVELMNDGRTLASSQINTSAYENFICLHIGSGIGGGVVSNGVLVTGANGNAGEFGALFPEGPDRPVERAFLAACGLTSWADWTGLPPRAASFLDTAAAQFSDVITGILPLLDFDAVLVCSRMPQDLLDTLCDRITIEPLGTGRFDTALTTRNPAPIIQAKHVPNHAHLACRMALDAALATTPSAKPKG
jgi:predicted NBD/HSP70 family sugar kinase